MSQTLNLCCKLANDVERNHLCTLSEDQKLRIEEARKWASELETQCKAIAVQERKGQWDVAEKVVLRPASHRESQSQKTTAILVETNPKIMASMRQNELTSERRAELKKTLAGWVFFVVFCIDFGNQPTDFPLPDGKPSFDQLSAYARTAIASHNFEVGGGWYKSC
jgi:hypothetical protein